MYQVNHTTIPRISHTGLASQYEPRPMRCGVRKEAANPPQNCPSIVPSGMNGPLLGLPSPLSLPPFAPFSSRAHFRAFPGAASMERAAVAWRRPAGHSPNPRSAFRSSPSSALAPLLDRARRTPRPPEKYGNREARQGLRSSHPFLPRGLMQNVDIAGESGPVDFMGILSL